MRDKITYIIFDLNGTLVSGHYPSYLEALEKLGYEPGKEAEKQFTEEGAREIARGHTPLPHAIDRFAKGEDPVKAKRKIIDYMVTDIHLRKSTKQILDRLKGHYTLLLATDTTGVGKKVVEKFRFDNFFQEVFYSCDVGYLKNEEGFWKYILDRFPNVSPSECAVVGDNPATDIRIPNKLGMYTILISSSITTDRDYTAKPTENRHETPNVTVEDLGALSQIFDE